MSYQVLARKWRPQNFKQMVGQEHVLQALVHALESQRLHHAYLFTGTRGVGKTTIGRILARCLSCQTGITAEPCGECGACQAISQGRYVDLIEIDAASRTKVEDMRELLENVQYAPTEGRFKIYLIDEVHMLSSHSFNALLKTLEEPPEHVKFLFATTDPQKLPITILSRCLQFNLKNMTPERIVSHLKYVLGEEQVSSEEAALWALARAADGSMRDALSLTDQAIAYAKGALTETQVSSMLGTVDQKKVYRLIDQLLARSAEGVMSVIRDLAEYAPDYGAVLERVASIFHRVAVEQAVPGSTDNSQGDQEKIKVYAGLLSAEDTQLYYQIALVSRKDLAITPDARAGFEMALLRMLAFQLEAPETLPSEPLSNQTELSSPASISANELSERDSALSQNVVDEDAPVESITDPSTEATAQFESEPEVPQKDVEHVELNNAPEAQKKTLATDQSKLQHEVAASEVPAVAVEAVNHGNDSQVSEAVAEGPNDGGPASNDAPIENNLTESGSQSENVLDMEWPRQAIRLGLSGMTQNLLFNMYKSSNGDNAVLNVESGHYRLLTDNHKKRIVEALREHLGLHGSIEFIDGLVPGQETPAMWRERINAERLRQAKDSLQADPNVQTLIAEFDARLVEESVVALGEVN